MITKRSIRYRVLSDIHLGHKRTRTRHIIDSMRLLFNDYEPRTDLDIIFLAGDVFDQLLDFSLPEIDEIIFWMHRLLDYCKRNNIRYSIFAIYFAEF